MFGMFLHIILLFKESEIKTVDIAVFLLSVLLNMIMQNTKARNLIPNSFCGYDVYILGDGALLIG